MLRLKAALDVCCDECPSSDECMFSKRQDNRCRLTIVDNLNSTSIAIRSIHNAIKTIASNQQIMQIHLKNMGDTSGLPHDASLAIKHIKAGTLVIQSYQETLEEYLINIAKVEIK